MAFNGATVVAAPKYNPNLLCVFNGAVYNVRIIVDPNNLYLLINYYFVLQFAYSIDIAKLLSTNLNPNPRDACMILMLGTSGQ